MMEGLDQFYADLSTPDTKKKITHGQNIINYLGDPNNSIECEDTGGFVDALVPWMQSSNFKVRNFLRLLGTVKSVIFYLSLFFFRFPKMGLI